MQTEKKSLDGFLSQKKPTARVSVLKKMADIKKARTDGHSLRTIHEGLTETGAINCSYKHFTVIVNKYLPAINETVGSKPSGPKHIRLGQDEKSGFGESRIALTPETLI